MGGAMEPGHAYTTVVGVSRAWTWVSSLVHSIFRSGSLPVSTRAAAMANTTAASAAAARTAFRTRPPAVGAMVAVAPQARAISIGAAAQTKYRSRRSTLLDADRLS